MSKNKACIMMALSLVSAAAYAAKDSSFKFENNLRVGYDDNVLGTSSEEDSMTVSDLIRATFKAQFSQRTELLLYYSPEFIYRADIDPDFVSYHDVYGKLSHQASQTVGITVSDRFRYQDKDVQTTGLSNTSADRNYAHNDLQGALDLQMSSLNALKVSGGYQVRLWDDSAYAANNDYDEVNGDLKFVRELKADTTDGFVGVSGSSLDYDGNRGGYDSFVAYAGADHAFNPVTTANIKLGYQFSEVDAAYGAESSDNNAPYLSVGVKHEPSARTSISGSLGYSMSASDNEIYNAQNRLSLVGAVKQDITAKISLTATAGYVLSQYDTDDALPDADDSYLNLSVRAAYQISRNHFVDAGYRFTTRDGDFDDYNRNRVDIGWRVSL